MNKNKVAESLKITGYASTTLVASVGIILLGLLGMDVLIFLTCEVSAFLIGLLFYAFGEHIQLLQDIKDNMSKIVPADQPTEDEIPDI